MKVKRVLLGVLILVLSVCTGMYLNYYFSSEPTPRSEEITDDLIGPSSFFVGDYVLYNSGPGICMTRQKIIVYRDFPTHEIAFHEGCFADAYYYIKDNGVYYTIDEAIKNGLITKEDWEERGRMGE